MNDHRFLPKRFVNRRLFVAVLMASSLYSQEVIDGIAAIVGDNIILRSEVAELVFRSALERRLDPQQDAEKIANIQEQVLQTLINQKIMLEIAEIETIEVQDREVNTALDHYFSTLVSQYGSEQRVAEIAGKTVSELRREFWPNMRDQLITQRFQETLLANISVTRDEVISFYEEYRDSLQAFPTLYHLSHILFKVLPGKASRDSALTIARRLRERVLSGEDFAVLATDFSNDPGSAPHGGELGLVDRGTFVPEFEQVAFSLNPGEVSEIVKTEFGYHIIQLVQKIGEKINVRHILITPQVTSADEDSVWAFALSIGDSLVSGAEFPQMAKRYSDDSLTKDQAGQLGWINPSNFPIPEIIQVLPSLIPNEVSPPVRAGDGYHLIIMNDVQPGGRPTLESHWSQIHSIALNKKNSDFFSAWLNKASSSIYVKILLD